MKRWQIFTISIIAVIGLNFGSVSSQLNASSATLFEGMGNYSHPITTTSLQAQRYFNQGLTLAYGFNHGEAARSFRQAIAIDADCAMCYWGLAYVLGPNINAQMNDADIPESYQAVQQAVSLSSNSSPREQAYINALATRYTDKPVTDRSYLDIAYANAMAEVAQKYPDDLDAATLYGEALMTTMPWDYWTATKEPKPETQIVFDTLESVLASFPDHLGANHLYIHAVEAVHPQRAIAVADRLGDLAPGLGHLVHMPSHIYIRVGRYHDAAIANQKAIAADNNYLAQCHAQGLYPIAYMPHNHHFLWFAAVMEGDSQLAAKTASDVANMVDPQRIREPGMGILQHFNSIPLFTMIRFGQWDKILTETQPAADLKYPTGVWHYARGLAYTSQNQIDLAQQELAQLKILAQDAELESVTIWDINTSQSILQLATEVLTGEIAAKQGDWHKAIAHLSQGVILEDALNYDEPADWSTPVRHYLGVALLEAQDFAAAEAVYREDLSFYPDNGWSLFGLQQSLLKQNKIAEAQQIKQKFDNAWQYADVQLTASKL